MGIMYDIKPCPFAGNCEKETPACNSEKSGTCPVIVQPKPEPVKMYDPQELVAVTLTREQWCTVIWKLEYYRSVSVNKAIELADYPAHAFGPETAAKHRAEAEKVAAILAKIEKDYYGEQ